MSLDFYLYNTENKVKECICSYCENKHTHIYEELLFHINITHNLGQMAEAAKIYNCLWRHEENGFKYAEDIIAQIQKGYIDLCNKPEYFSDFNAKNGWGTYGTFKECVRKILDACLDYPKSEIRVWK